MREETTEQLVMSQPFIDLWKCAGELSRYPRDWLKKSGQIADPSQQCPSGFDRQIIALNVSQVQKLFVYGGNQSFLSEIFKKSKIKLEEIRRILEATNKDIISSAMPWSNLWGEQLIDIDPSIIPLLFFRTSLQEQLDKICKSEKIGQREQLVNFIILLFQQRLVGEIYKFTGRDDKPGLPSLKIELVNGAEVTFSLDFPVASGSVQMYMVLNHTSGEASITKTVFSEKKNVADLVTLRGGLRAAPVQKEQKTVSGGSPQGTGGTTGDLAIPAEKLLVKAAAAAKPAEKVCKTVESQVDAGGGTKGKAGIAAGDLGLNTVLAGWANNFWTFTGWRMALGKNVPSSTTILAAMQQAVNSCLPQVPNSAGNQERVSVLKLLGNHSLMKVLVSGDSTSQKENILGLAKTLIGFYTGIIAKKKEEGEEVTLSAYVTEPNAVAILERFFSTRLRPFGINFGVRILRDEKLVSDIKGIPGYDSLPQHIKLMLDKSLEVGSSPPPDAPFIHALRKATSTVTVSGALGGFVAMGHAAVANDVDKPGTPSPAAGSPAVSRSGTPNLAPQSGLRCSAEVINPPEEKPPLVSSVPS